MYKLLTTKIWNKVVIKYTWYFPFLLIRGKPKLASTVSTPLALVAQMVLVSYKYLGNK